MSEVLPSLPKRLMSATSQAEGSSSVTTDALTLPHIAFTLASGKHSENTHESRCAEQGKQAAMIEGD